jgi:thioesterase domain-containing protein
VARGYLNRPELTRERFIPDPFRPGERLYRTGDLVRRRPDGTIVFLGRADNQVKLRGLRMELGEIEAALAAHPAVAQAVVTVITAPSGDKELVAYLRPAHELPPDQELRAHLARTLPAAMIPAHLIAVPEIPLNSNGKIDKTALPAPRSTTQTRPHVLPETPAETLLVTIYATLLGATGVSATDSFFDLGGNSLTAMRLVDAIARETGADVAVTSIFLHPTPRALAATLDRARTGPLIPLTHDGPPLILIHPIGGTVSAYTPLAQQLAGTLAVTGLESPALTGDTPIPATLPALITDYTRRIQSAHPTGPYQLAGWSMGGVLAFEIARRLEQSGAAVTLLVLLDAPFAIPPTFLPSPPALAHRFLTDALQATQATQAPQAPPDPAVTTPDDQLAWLARHLSAEGDPALAAQLKSRFALFAAHTRMLAGYQPSQAKLRAPTLIISANDSPNFPARFAWPNRFAGPVSIMCVQADHYAFLRPPLVADVAAAIRTWREGHPDEPPNF